jgi:hypothetical protein
MEATPPSLRFVFDRPATGQKPITVQDGRPVGQSKYFHVQVHSPVRIPANTCTGQITLLEEMDESGDYRRAPALKPPVSLTWDSEPGLTWPHSIEPGLPGRLNIAFTESTQPGMTILCVPSHEPRGNLNWLPPGTYRLTLRAQADGLGDAQGVGDREKCTEMITKSAQVSGVSQP